MIISEDQKLLVSNLGWVDKGRLWVYDIETLRQTYVQVAETDHLKLVPGLAGFFGIIYKTNNGLVISARHLSAPGEVISEVQIFQDRYRFSGEAKAWTHLPQYFTEYSDWSAEPEYLLISIDPSEDSLVVGSFPWFNKTEYDLGYQSILDVTEMPGTRNVLVSIQRSNHLILHDPLEQTAVGRIELPGARYGNAQVHLSRDGSNIWVDNYDTLGRLDTNSYEVEQSVRLQEGNPAGEHGFTNLFIGDFALNQDETVVAVARPYSADVVGVDPITLEVISSWASGGQPLEVAVMTDNRAVSRDWKTGEFREGILE